MSALRSRGPLLVLVLALVALPVGPATVAGPLQLVQLLDVAVVGAVVAVRLWHGRVPLPLPGPLLWGVALLAVVVLSTGLSVAPEVSARQVVALSVGLGLCAAAVAVCSDPGRWRVAVRALLVGAVLVCVPAVLSARELDSRLGGAVVNDRPVGVFAQPNELGAFAMITTLVALGLLLGAASRLDRRLALLALAASGTALAVSLSRGAWIGTVLGVGLVLLLVPRARRPVLGTGAGAVVLVAVLAVVAPSLTPVQVVVERVASLGSSEDNPYDDRPRIWDEALRTVRERPLLGVGPGAFEIASTRSVSVARTVHAQHAHDVLLTAGAETGLLGVGALLGLTGSSAVLVLRGVRAARRRPELLGPLAGLAGAMLAVIGQGVFDVPMRNALVAQTLWVALGLALAGALLALRAPSGPVAAVPAPRTELVAAR